MEDLDKCILHSTEAILLPPLPVAGPALNIVELVFRLASSLLYRSKASAQLDDVQCSIEYFRYLRRLPLDSLGVPRRKVTGLLTEALGLHVQLDIRDAARNMEEMLVLCRELLSSDISTNFPTAALASLYPAIHTELFRGQHGPLVDDAIRCLRDAVKMCPPHVHQVRLGLASSLYDRFAITHASNDYEDARVLFETIVDPNQSRENMDPDQVLASIGLLGLAYSRANYSKNPEHFEEAISHCRSMLSCSSLPQGVRSHITGCMVLYARRRFQYHGLSDGPQPPSSFDPELVSIVSSQGPAAFEDLSYFDAVRETYSKAAVDRKILDLKEILSNERPGTPSHSKCLDRLAGWYRTKFSLTNDVMDIDESIKYWRLLLDAADSSSRSEYLVRLCTTLVRGFKGTNDIRYLDESIDLCYELLKLKSEERMHFDIIRMLISSLFGRLSFFNRIEDLNEVMRLTPLAVDNRYAQAPQRFQLSCIWAYIARRIRHPSVLVAYTKSMALMQDSLSFSPTLQIQHDRLVAMDEYCRRMPFDYASYQVNLGQLEAAVETLEQGRALLWSEMRGLRTPITEPIKEDLPLTKRLAEINQELETLTTSIAPSRKLEVENRESQGGDGMDAFGRLFVRQRKLLEERDTLISQIQGRPGFEGFSMTPSFATLRSAASRGPVIIINHCEWRCDILILLSDGPPSLLQTPEDFFDRASQLKARLLDTRNHHGLDSPEYEHALAFVLSELYQLVGKPVIQRLRELGIPEQSRIWWCPTSVFCSLPLHAMGPIPPTDEVEAKPKYISDLYICSYTPTLSALIESRSRETHLSGNPSLLLVAQPDASLPEAQTEIKVVQGLSMQVTSLVSEDATRSAVVEGLGTHQLVHFACHGTLERAKPFDASFELHGADRLTLLEIVRSRLPSAEFAFLAACHTAELTEDSVSDEGLHLVAAMQYCGFRSAVGTMWAMADVDGPDLAKHFYRSMFAKRKKSTPYYERSAEALRDAVQKLRRKKRISLERWVNFVHYGA
jgi:CHAT domain-containing protein/tetratricopeptide (TPR) repeat protein